MKFFKIFSAWEKQLHKIDLLTAYENMCTTHFVVRGR